VHILQYVLPTAAPVVQPTWLKVCMCALVVVGVAAVRGCLPISGHASRVTRRRKEGELRSAVSRAWYTFVLYFYRHKHKTYNSTSHSTVTVCWVYMCVCVCVHRRSKSRKDLMRFPYNIMRLSNLINVIRRERSSNIRLYSRYSLNLSDIFNTRVFEKKYSRKTQGWSSNNRIICLKPYVPSVNPFTLFSHNVII